MDIRNEFEEWANADNRRLESLEFEERTPGNNHYYEDDSTNQAYIGWCAALRRPAPSEELRDVPNRSDLAKLLAKQRGHKDIDETIVMQGGDNAQVWEFYLANADEILELLAHSSPQSAGEPTRAQVEITKQLMAEIKRLRAALQDVESVIAKFLAHQFSHADGYDALAAVRTNAKAALKDAPQSAWLTGVIKEAAENMDDDANDQATVIRHGLTIMRLRSLLLTVPCPAAGWTGQPKEIEHATVKDCMKHGVCGCVFGDALKEAPPPFASGERASGDKA